jgi:hypothetical protein
MRTAVVLPRASTVWGKLRQQNYFTRSREEREGKSFLRLLRAFA